MPRLPFLLVLLLLSCAPLRAAPLSPDEAAVAAAVRAEHGRALALLKE
jgi:hypothetical protein